MTKKKDGNSEKEVQEESDPAPDAVPGTGTPQLPPPVRTEIKLVRHDLTMEERNAAGSDLARELSKGRGIEAEFDQVKASYKAKTTENETRIDSLSTLIMNGFEMRSKPCEVQLFPEEGVKRFYLFDAPEDALPVLTEAMTQDDYQADLIQAESAFECREEIELWPPINDERAVLAVGRLKDKWFAALRVQIGARRIDERLDSEQPCSKKRADMIKRSAKRLQEWLATSLGKENAKGFDGPIAKVVEAHKEREE